MGSSSWNCQDSQSKDPYAFKLDDNDVGYCLYRQKKQHKSVTKTKKFFKNCSSRFSVNIYGSREECVCNSSWYSSHAISSQIDERTVYKQNYRIQDVRKPYRFFKSRNSFSLCGNLKSLTGPNSKCSLKEYSHIEHSSKNCLANNGNDKTQKASITQDVGIPGIFPTNSFIKENKTNSSNTTKLTAPSKEENMSSLVPRILPHTNDVKETVSANVNLRSIRKLFQGQSSQIPSQLAKPFMFQVNRKNILYRQWERKILAKPNKFFKSRNRDAISDPSFTSYITYCCAYQDSLNVQKNIPGSDSPINRKPLSKDPYSLETEDDNYPDKQNKELKYVATENRCIHQDRRRHNIVKCLPGRDSPLSSKSHASEIVGDTCVATLKKKLKSVKKQNTVFKSSNAQFSTEVKQHKCMQSIDTDEQKLSHSPRKQNFMSSKIKAINHPIIGQFKKENNLPIANTTDNEVSGLINESDEAVTLHNSSENVGLNLHGQKRCQSEVRNLCSPLTCKGKNGQSHISVTSAKKCSIGYTYVIKDTLSTVTQKRNSFKNADVESILREDKEACDTLLASGNIHAHETNTKIFPVIRNLAELNIHSNPAEKKYSGVMNITDNDEQSNLMSNTSMVCNGTTVSKPLLETNELCMSETNSTHLDDTTLKLSKQIKASSMSSIIHFNTETEISDNENVQNHIIIDEFDSKAVVDEIEDHFKNTEKDYRPSFSPQQKDPQKTLRNPFTEQIESTNTAHGKHRMENQIQCKDNADKGLIKLKVNAIPTHIKTKKSLRSETECSAKQTRNSINNKIFLPTVKRGNSCKKRIFISRKRKNSALVYRHKWVDDTNCEKDTKLTSAKLLVQPIQIINSSHDLEKLKLPLLCIASKHAQSIDSTNDDESVMDLKCNEVSKKYYTVINNVRKSDEIQELGELQEFNDDVEYILDALQHSNPIVIRCHSALNLASKCLNPAFRMHIRTCGAMTKFFHALYDAAKDQSLALCTAAIIFILSQYQMLTFSSNSMQLLFTLLNSYLTCEAECVQLQAIKRKTLELCTEVQSQGFAKHLHLVNITVNQLASEALLSLTSCETGYLFEDGLREMESLDHIMKAINTCRAEIESLFIESRGSLHDKLRFLNYCFHVLECVTDQSEENQLYILKYENGCFMRTMATLFKKCTTEIRNADQVDSAHSALTLELLLTILKVLINLTHRVNDASLRSSLIAKRPELIHTSLYVLLQASNNIPEEKKFDLLVLVLMFLVKVVEQNTCNRKLIFETRVSDIMIHSGNDNHIIKILIAFFYQQEELARIEELKTDAMLDGQIGSEHLHESQEPSQEFIATLEEKAGQNMEYTMIASYLVLLIGYLIIDNEEYEMYVHQCLPQKSFSTMISVLEKMHNFLNLVPTISGKQDVIQTQQIIQYLRQSDKKAKADTFKDY